MKNNKVRDKKWRNKVNWRCLSFDEKRKKISVKSENQFEARERKVFYLLNVRTFLVTA